MHPGNGPRFRRRVTLAGLLALGAAGGCATGRTGNENRLGSDWLMVNGVPQWLAVYGTPRTGPVLLLLHGGPGGSETLLFRHVDRALEERYRVAYWDQRGAGRSYDPADPPPDMTVTQFVSDLGVVVDHLRRRLGSPIVLLGHSWGSALGLLYAKERPDTVRGCIGVAQVADQAAQERASYAFALEEARRRHNEQAIRELLATGAPPLDVDALFVKNGWVEAFGGTFAKGFSKMGLVFSALVRGETTIGEIRRLIAANEFSLRAMWPEVRTLDLPALVPEVAVPTAFLLGRHDQQCPSALAAAYFDRLAAPDKSMVWFERSAHNVPFEEPDAFTRTVVELVERWA